MCSSTYPALRIINRHPLTDDYTRSWNIVGIVLATAWVRTAVFLYISYRLRKGFLLQEYFTIDNLMGRVLCVELAFAFWTVGLYGDAGKCFLVIFSSVSMDWSLAGNVRIMLRYYDWNWWTLRIYQLQRLYAPVFYVAVGVYFTLTEPAASGYRKNLFVLYLVFGMVYFQDLFVRACNTAIDAAKQKRHLEIQALRAQEKADDAWRASQDPRAQAPLWRRLFAPKSLRYQFSDEETPKERERETH